VGVRPLVTPPFRGNLLDSFFYYWVERSPGGRFATITWQPGTPAERNEAARLFEAAHGGRSAGTSEPTRPPADAPNPDEERLIRAVLADRSAERPYLDYATFLTARGDTYGDYIRLTLEMQRLPVGHPERERTERHRAQLVLQDGPRWVLPLTDLGLFPGESVADADGYVPDIWYGDKGVIEALDVPREAHVLPGNLSRLFQAAPFLRALRITSDTSTVADIGGVPELARIEALELALADGTPEDFRRFAESPYLGGLRRLELRNYQFGPFAAEHLARAAWLAGVRELDLTGNAMGDRGAEALAASPHMADLTTARLGSNDFTDRGLIALGTSPILAGLTALHLEGGDYGEAGTRALAAAPFADRLTSLDLSDSGLTDARWERLGERGWPPLSPRRGSPC
jgi:hypothetical protein